MFQIDSATPLSFTNIKFSSKYPNGVLYPSAFLGRLFSFHSPFNLFYL